MRPHWLVGLAAAVLANALPVPAESKGRTPTVTERAAAPLGGEALGVDWADIHAPGIGEMKAAVARPKGPGPFPTVLLLHGSHGFAPEYVTLARDLAARGVMGVAPCWFTGGGGSGVGAVSKALPCPKAPVMPAANSREAMFIVLALVQATRALPGVDPQRVALFGHSRGGGAALSYATTGNAGHPPGAVSSAVTHGDPGTIYGVIADSAGYRDPLLELATSVNVPVFILHGEADSPAGGGSEFTDVRRVREFESLMRRLGRPIGARYYPGSGHNGIFLTPGQREDSVARIVEFVTTP